MDGDFRLDLGEVIKNIETAEVMAIYFPLLRKTLLMDTRYDSENGPIIKVVPMVDSVEERLRSLKRMRPRLPRPESITIIPWPKYATSLQRLGIWDKIAQRLVSTGHKDAVKACANCWRELQKLEMAELGAVIRGDKYYTLWQAKR